MVKHRKSKFVLIGVTFISCLLIICMIYQQIHQQDLDSKLVCALRQLDSRTALKMLAEGASANAHKYRQVPNSFWFTLKHLFIQSPESASLHAPSALFVAIDWRWQEVADKDEFRLTSYTPANAPPQDTRVISALLEHGADFMATNEAGFTPLQVAAWEGKSSTVRLLLEHGAPVNLCGSERSQTTPLMYAICAGDILTIQVLLQHHADIQSIRNRDGYTSLTLATARNDAIVINLLKQTLKK